MKKTMMKRAARLVTPARRSCCLGRIRERVGVTRQHRFSNTARRFGCGFGRAAFCAALLASAHRDAAAQPPGASCRMAGGPVALRELPEASGAASSRRTAGLIWSHNDSGEAIVFGIDAQGAIQARVHVTGASVDDWEDLAVGPCPQGACLYVADIGDNNAKRSRITIYRVPEPRPGESATPTATAFHATYPDGAHDAEAFFVTADGDLFVITKDGNVLYRFPRALQPGATVSLQRVGALEIPPAATDGENRSRAGRVTDAETSPDGRWVAVRTNEQVLFYRTGDLVSGSRRAALRLDIRHLREPQGEGVALGPDGTLFILGEGGGKRRAGTMARLACALDSK
jgi:hypothetical protein